MKPGAAAWSIHYGFDGSPANGLVMELFEASSASPAWFRTANWAISYRKLPDGREPQEEPGCRAVLESVRSHIQRLDDSPTAPDSMALRAAVETYRSDALTRVGETDPTAPSTARMQSLLLNITTFCNAKCPFCIVGDSLNRAELNMTDEQIFGSVKKAREEGAWELGFSGGEPTLHPRLVEVIAYAKSLGYTHQSINTNGIKLKSAAYCRELLAAGLTSIDISIHGHTDELHDREVARPGAMAAIREACGHLRELKKEFRFHTSGTTVITNHNHTVMREICEFLDTLGIEHKRLKYAYEGYRINEAVIDQVAPYHQVVPSVQSALEYLSQGRWGFDVTHVPLCLLGDHAVFSSDYERREALMVFRKEAQLGDPAHYMRRHAPECEACVLKHQCTRLDRAYQAFHGQAALKAFETEAEVEALFARGLARWPGRQDIIGSALGHWHKNKGAADPGSTSVALPVLAPIETGKPKRH